MRRAAILSVLTFLLLATAPARAQTSGERWELGARLSIWNAGGEPANDLTGTGAYARYRVSDHWLVGFAVDSITGDYERPYEFVGLTSPEEIDGTIDALLWSGWVEREYGGPDRRLHWFWSAGIGFSSPEVDDVTGPVTGGGTFDVSTDPGSETLVFVGGGLKRRLGSRWSLEASVRASQHFADWKLTDRVSGRTGSIDDYTTIAAQLGLGFRF